MADYVAHFILLLCPVTSSIQPMSTSYFQPLTQVRLKVNFDTDEITRNFCRSFTQLGEVRVEDCSSDEGIGSWGVAVTSRDEIIVVDCR